MPQDDPTIVYGSWDPDSGEGTIWIRADFFVQDRIVQLDALQDWIADLTNTYDRLLSHPEYRSMVSSGWVHLLSQTRKTKTTAHARCCAADNPDTGGDDDGTDPESYEGGAGIVFEPAPGADLRGEVLSLLAGLGASYEVRDDLGVVYVTTGSGERWVCGLPRKRAQGARRRLGQGQGQGSRPSGQ